MEDTVGEISNYPYKGQPLRVTYKASEYTVQLLQKGLRKEDIEIRILLDGFVQQLEKRGAKWYFIATDQDQSLAQEIYRAISLRYRL